MKVKPCYIYVVNDITVISRKRCVIIDDIRQLVTKSNKLDTIRKMQVINILNEMSKHFEAIPYGTTKVSIPGGHKLETMVGTLF